MTDKYRVVFAGFDSSVSESAAIEQLSLKLKTTPQKVTAFTQGKSLFAPSEKTKCLKQVKLLASFGLHAKLQSTESNANSASSIQNSKDERILEALDYITSSLIRIEERIEELEQRLPSQEIVKENKVEDDWQEDDLFDELELDPPPKRSKKVQYGLGVVLIILLIILAIALAFPELVAF
jgi:flagellar capping protein FliD